MSSPLSESKQIEEFVFEIELIEFHRRNRSVLATGAFLMDKIGMEREPALVRAVTLDKVLKREL